MKNHEKQPGTMKNHEKQPGTMKNQPGEKVLIFITNAGSQLTFITQNEKVLIFCYQRGVTTDILDV